MLWKVVVWERLLRALWNKDRKEQERHCLVRGVALISNSLGLGKAGMAFQCSRTCKVPMCQHLVIVPGVSPMPCNSVAQHVGCMRSDSTSGHSSLHPGSHFPRTLGCPCTKQAGHKAFPDAAVGTKAQAGGSCLRDGWSSPNYLPFSFLTCHTGRDTYQCDNGEAHGHGFHCKCWGNSSDYCCMNQEGTSIFQMSKKESYFLLEGPIPFLI